MQKKVKNENIRTILYVFEAYHYPIEQIYLFAKNYEERIQKSSGIILSHVLISKQFDKMVSVDILNH